MDAIKFLKTFIVIIFCILFVSCTNDVQVGSSYQEQLLSLRNQSSMVYDEFPNIHYYLFGMGNRKKLIYHDHKLKGFINDSIYADFSKNFVSDSIIPYDYKVLVKTKYGKYEIKETEHGVFLNDSLLEGTSTYVHLPLFKDFVYDKILRVLHQELLFNIFDSMVMPNYAYQRCFYRDAAYAAMVLKETSNIKLIEKWVTSIDSIYDHARGISVKESDSPGELLYLISFFPEKCKKIREKVLEEIENIKLKDKKTGKFYISGIVDGKIRANYSTKWLIYGLKANGIDTSKWIIPDASKDDYADLFWMDFPKDGTQIHKLIWQGKVWCQKPFSSNIVAYPYLNIARAHYYEDPSYLLLNRVNYPLSWEGKMDDKKDPHIASFTHVWCAAELFMYLLQLKK